MERSNKDAESFEGSGNGKSVSSYFDGEIISRSFPFVTGKWDASIETDIRQWVSGLPVPLMFSI